MFSDATSTGINKHTSLPRVAFDLSGLPPATSAGPRNLAVGALDVLERQMSLRAHLWRRTPRRSRFAIASIADWTEGATEADVDMIREAMKQSPHMLSPCAAAHA